MADTKTPIGPLRWLAALMVIAALLSGSVFWARRVGVLEAETYWLGHSRMLDWARAQTDPVLGYERMVQFNNSLHDLSESARLLTKAPKEIVALLFLLLALRLFRGRMPEYGVLLPASGVMLLGAWAAIAAVATCSWIGLAAGARAFISWLIGFFGLNLSSSTTLRLISRALVWLLVIQALLVLVETQRGLLIYSMFLFDANQVRVAGSFSLPASLGCFAIVAWAAADRWGGYAPRAMMWLTAMILPILLFAASAAAWVGFVAVVATKLYSTANTRHRVGLLLAGVPLVALVWVALPSITGRLEVHNSLWGRIQPVHEYAARHLSTVQVIAGLGFGQGTNALASQETSPSYVGKVPNRPMGDSLPAALFWQLGLIGVILAYGWMAMAYWLDPRSRPLGIALIISSLAVNITELFPVNLVLGFWLAHAVRAREDDDAAA